VEDSFNTGEAGLISEDAPQLLPKYDDYGGEYQEDGEREKGEESKGMMNREEKRPLKDWEIALEKRIPRSGALRKPMPSQSSGKKW
jgi:hypothetical protein